MAEAILIFLDDVRKFGRTSGEKQLEGLAEGKTYVEGSVEEIFFII